MSLRECGERPLDTTYMTNDVRHVVAEPTHRTAQRSAAGRPRRGYGGRNEERL